MSYFHFVSLYCVCQRSLARLVCWYIPGYYHPSSGGWLAFEFFNSSRGTWQLSQWSFLVGEGSQANLLGQQRWLRGYDYHRHCYCSCGRRSHWCSLILALAWVFHWGSVSYLCPHCAPGARCTLCLQLWISGGRRHSAARLSSGARLAIYFYRRLQSCRYLEASSSSWVWRLDANLFDCLKSADSNLYLHYPWVN